MHDFFKFIFQVPDTKVNNLNVFLVLFRDHTQVCARSSGP